LAKKSAAVAAEPKREGQYSYISPLRTAGETGGDLFAHFFSLTLLLLLPHFSYAYEIKSNAQLARKYIDEQLSQSPEHDQFLQTIPEYWCRTSAI
jgi:hypothetical protein